MAKKKTEEKTVHRPADPNVMGLRGTVVEQPITRTLDENYMPYAMSVIVSRAIPEIDGFKPSHRKLLYTMYKMGLLTGGAPSPPTSWARPCASTPTATPPSTTPWCASPGATRPADAFCGFQRQLRQGLLPGHGLRRLPVHRGQAGRDL